MPYIGRRSFLLVEEKEEETMVEVSVNALHRAAFFSTAMVELLKGQAVMCQCPTSGGVHFYYDLEIEKFEEMASVNALYRAAFISTRTEHQEDLSS